MVVESAIWAWYIRISRMGPGNRAFPMQRKPQAARRKEEGLMRELIMENTGAAIGIAVCIALVAIVGVLCATNGTVQHAFVNMINTALSKAGSTAVP